MTRLVTYSTGNGARLGSVRDGMILDLALAADHQRFENTGWTKDSLAFLEAGDEACEQLRALTASIKALGDDAARKAGLLVAEADVQVLPPIQKPPKILCVGRNYGKHAAEAGRPISEIPIIFSRFAKTLVEQGGNVVVPTVSEQLDWEGELAVIIGKAGRHVRRADAMDYVAGYSIFNDVTVRDYQFRITQYTAGKNFSRSGPFGPYLVLTDEVADPHNLDIKTRLNGEIVQDGNTEEMLFDIPAIIEHLSEFIELEPGDVIPMGTPAGVGFTRTPPRFLRSGDIISVEVEGLGTLTNPVINEADA
ncbi:2-keto-4-pentenoate hydratase/2-oxohepta-3-ene-1,7-dioic acid hydratase (catechol pathway) [Devosia crocina]|uniref:2-keto-4-pentenoate hydratase/2-oxohepta-3-ene-1,7-dioic acid hydratase (Catechol pathway) n=1 Tax=Devosia crocina TaxID=429728 RepID=A0A1I7MYU3_9HYPH|nr:fumarylacetoacetate hydrolase family protein [Devosia crocina]SFV27538.1 2-keto-4-pentenoate hydratase/2-oxohepta-3-ene-1,7-dioic acid hydratase (catechol pathway) [Devosia crocina]